MSTLTLTTLPPEIRSAIFEQALSPTDQKDVRTTKGLGLLAASKQLYFETQLVPFQHNTVAVPPICDSSTRATYELLRRMSMAQRNAIRHLDLQVTGSMLDETAAVRILKYLRLGNADGDVKSELGVMALPIYDGDLRDINITISARDIAVPLADCRDGLRKTLDTESCEIFAWLRTFPTLRSFRLHVRLSKADQFPQTQRNELDRGLLDSLDPTIRVKTTFDVVGDDGYFLDELDIFPDSYVGLCGNIGPCLARLNGHGL